MCRGCLFCFHLRQRSRPAGRTAAREAQASGAYSFGTARPVSRSKKWRCSVLSDDLDGGADGDARSGCRSGRRSASGSSRPPRRGLGGGDVDVGRNLDHLGRDDRVGLDLDMHEHVGAEQLGGRPPGRGDAGPAERRSRRRRPARAPGGPRRRPCRRRSSEAAGGGGGLAGGTTAAAPDRRRRARPSSRSSRAAASSSDGLPMKVATKRLTGRS